MRLRIDASIKNDRKIMRYQIVDFLKYKYISLFVFAVIFFISFNGESQTTNTYNFTGSSEYFTVPACTDSLIITACGAQGGGAVGGNGACVDVTIPVNQGDQLEIIVGGQGSCPNAGFNGGGAGNPANSAANASCGGGGASEIIINGTPVVIAGAGGGQGGGNTNDVGGVGGCASGGTGATSFGQGASGGTQNSSGTGGGPWGGGNTGSSGSGSQGGAGASDPCFNLGPGGGGGGGYYGGGGGGSDCFGSGSLGGGGGGGGSSLVPAGGICTSGSNSGNGYIEITFVEGSFDYDVTSTSCLGANDGEIVAFTDQANSEFSFDGGLTFSTDSVLTDLASGFYEICVNFSGGNCASACDSVEVLDGPPIDVTTSNDTLICENGTAELWAQGVQGTTFTYSWSHTNDQNSNVDANPTDPSTYWVIAENELGCNSDTAYIDVDLYPSISGAMSPNDYVCPGFEGLLSVTPSGGNGGPYSFSWAGPTGNVISDSSSMIDNPMDTTSYYVTITDGCESSPATIEGVIDVAPLPEIEVSVDDPLKCNPAIFNFSFDTPLDDIANYTWVFPINDTLNDISNFELFYDEVGNYDATVFIETNDGCLDTALFENFFQVVPQPTANFEYAPEPMGYLEPKAEFLNSSTNADYYEWYIEQGQPSYSEEVNPNASFPIGEIGEYEVTLIAISDLGCYDSITKIIEVGPEVVLYVPNTFTPDGDGVNETWRPFIEGIDIQNFQLIIFNRWGEVVFESLDPEGSWDGRYGGKPVKEGTYIWTIKAADPISDEKYEWSGHVTVIR